MFYRVSTAHRIQSPVCLSKSVIPRPLGAGLEAIARPGVQSERKRCRRAIFRAHYPRQSVIGEFGSSVARTRSDAHRDELGLSCQLVNLLEAEQVDRARCHAIGATLWASRSCAPPGALRI